MDSHTLLITATILMFIVTTVLASTWHFNRQIPGLGSWALSCLSGFALCSLLMANQYLSSATQVLATQTISFLVAYLSFAGARAYVGRPAPGAAYPIGAALLLVAFTLYFTLAQPHPGIRFTASSLATGLLFLLGARTLAVGAVRTYPARYLFALASALHGAFLVVRPALFAPGNGGLFDANHALAISAFVVLESIVALVLLAFGALMLANEYSTNALRHLAERDALTGVFNRRCFIDLLGKALSRYRRSGLPSAVLLLDLDHFKSINDTLGHKGGDDALRHFVNTALGSLRKEDVIGRIGGEEFAILLSSAGRGEALATAERVRAAIAASGLQGVENPSIQITISVGVAVSRCNDTIESMLDRADRAMYEAKHKGRNRVETLEAEDVLQFVANAA